MMWEILDGCGEFTRRMARQSQSTTLFVRPGVVFAETSVAETFSVRPWQPEDGVPQDAVQWVDSAELWVVASGVNAIAIAAWRPIADREHELLYVATVPAERRKGAARMLVSELMSRHPGTWFLEVRESNEAARALYARLGFELRGRRIRYYSDPEEDGLVLAATSS